MPASGVRVHAPRVEAASADGSSGIFGSGLDGRRVGVRPEPPGDTSHQRGRSSSISFTKSRIASKDSILPRLSHVSCFARSGWLMPHRLRGSQGPSVAWRRSAYSTSRVSSLNLDSIAGRREASTAA